MKRFVLLVLIGILASGCAARVQYVTQKDFQSYQKNYVQTQNAILQQIKKYIDAQDNQVLQTTGGAMQIFVRFVFRCLDKQGIKVDVAKEWKLFQEESQKQRQLKLPKPQKP